MINRVAVLMSTYNGEKFLEAQVDSLLQQTGVDVTIFVRDDGSTDKTINLLQHYANQDKIIILENQNNNLGVGNSFMELLYFAGQDFDYYAFCDQDDIWKEDKLSRAINHLMAADKPTLYCSNQLLVDSNLKELGLRHSEKLGTSYLEILTENKISGCTMVWNNKLQLLLHDEKRRPSSRLLKVRIHDVWVAMIASSLGDIIYDSQSRILYRQHADNVVGVRKVNRLVNWRKKISQKELRNGRSLLAQEVLERYSDLLPLPIRDVLEVFSEYRTNYRKKIMLLSNSYFFKYSKESKLAIGLKVMMNLI